MTLVSLIRFIILLWLIPLMSLNIYIFFLSILSATVIFFSAVNRNKINYVVVNVAPPTLNQLIKAR